MAHAIVLLFTLPACERFAHPKYDPPQYTSGSGGFGGSGSVSSGVAGPGDDLTVPGCGVVAGGVGGGGEGARCTAANDCAIVCCSCNGNTGGGEWSAASCVGGFCAGQPSTCGRTSACGSGAVVVGGASAPDACGGGSYADPTCDACMRASCCLEEAACANDGSCGAVDTCVTQCSDSDCVASCEAIYGSSVAAANLDACFAASCANACP
jgi:hypothetical protein